jgi:glycosyltransferase involved in cell wall biosynthesis
MRVLYLTAAAELGGAERSLLDILASVRQAQPAWALSVISGVAGPLLERAAALGVVTEVIPFDPALASVGERSDMFGFAALTKAVQAAQRYVALLEAAFERHRPDVLHTNGLKMHVLGARALTPPTALIWHLHDYIGSRRVSRHLLRWHARTCAAVVANSESVADDARRTFGARVPVIAVYNGIDLHRFSSSGARLDLDALAGLPEAPAGTVRVGLVATFGHWKGHMTFLDALARLPREMRIRAYVIGGAVYQTAASQHTLDDLQAYASRLGLGDRVGFTGFVANPDEAFRALDIVVHASTAPEPFGLVIAEAMACERAVIASDAGGARELFTPGVDALPHTPGSADSLASGIAELARDRGARVRLGHAGRQTAEKRFDRRRLASELLPVYERAAAHS